MEKHGFALGFYLLCSYAVRLGLRGTCPKHIGLVKCGPSHGNIPGQLQLRDCTVVLLLHDIQPSSWASAIQNKRRNPVKVYHIRSQSASPLGLCYVVASFQYPTKGSSLRVYARCQSRVAHWTQALSHPTDKYKNTILSSELVPKALSLMDFVVDSKSNSI